jgi:Protein of unknown function (DUF2735)
MSARIYPFPARGRFAADERGEKSQAGSHFPSARVTNIVCSDAWYHEEALETERAGKSDKNK